MKTVSCKPHRSSHYSFESKNQYVIVIVTEWEKVINFSHKWICLFLPFLFINNVIDSHPNTLSLRRWKISNESRKLVALLLSIYYVSRIWVANIHFMEKYLNPMPSKCCIIQNTSFIYSAFQEKLCHQLYNLRFCNLPHNRHSHNSLGILY